MCKIAICFGSACYLKGSYAVLNAFQALIEKYNVKATVDIEGSFCQSMCTQGVVIKINDEMISNVTRENVYKIFEEKVLGA
jgi:NADH-quinone oxidoreductase subunit G